HRYGIRATYIKVSRWIPTFGPARSLNSSPAKLWIMVAPTLGNTIGAMFIGLLLTTLLFGIICLQAYNYYQKFPDDRAHFKIFVRIVSHCVSVFDQYYSVSATNVLLLSSAMYHYLIKNFGNFEALLSPYIFITWMCQLYVATNFRGNRFLTGGIICLTCTHLGKSIRAAKSHNSTTSYTPVLIGMTLGSALACDILITASLCFFLNTKRTGFRRTDSLINTLILFSVCTGLVTSVFATVNIIVFFSMKTNLIHLGIWFLMGELYTTSLLTTLNSRDVFRGQWNHDDRTVDLSTLSSAVRQQPSMMTSQDRKVEYIPLYYVGDKKPKFHFRDGTQSQFT
ncbi:hypothetical protein BD410DRAFT_785112, partial [Rickenella mellea]